jgi:2-polyprenyl-6-methoxyphenol hydroxylase-like FAD-dependent oxidoreductase
MVLQVLYNNIKDKTKILTNKRVENVEVTGTGVIAKTSDGSAYHGDILVGADGIHSTVRDEMWRIANKVSPGWIPSDEHSGKYEKFHELIKLTCSSGPLRLWLCVRNIQSL